jgi:hypothetical protein
LKDNKRLAFGSFPVLAMCEGLHTSIARSHVGFNARDSGQERSVTRSSIVLLLILLAACSDENPPKQAVNQMIESPLQNTVISSFEIYPPKPIPGADGRLSPVYFAESD